MLALSSSRASPTLSVVLMTVLPVSLIYRFLLQTYFIEPEFCGHLNVQRAVMKLSETSCGLDIVMDGITKKLPYSMKEHSCTGFQKRLSGQADQERAIMCSPTDSADEINDGMDYQDRACWR